MHKIDFSTIPWVESAAGARHKVFKHEGKQIRLLEFRREFVEPDWCRKGHIGYMLEGQLEVDFSGKVVTFKAGDGVFIPAGETHKHKARAVSEVVRLVLVEEV